MPRRRVAINGRFLTVPVSGVQRYAREVIQELSLREEIDGVVIVPPAELVPLNRFCDLAARPASERWSGVRGHAWEQVVLPMLVRRSRAHVLVSPCNWGPIAVRRQLTVFHDTAPLFHPEYFQPRYVRLARAMTPWLVRRSPRSAVTCERVRDELVCFAGATPLRVDVVPPGVGAPFTEVAVDLTVPRHPSCVFVGGNDVRKNLGFLTSFWPRVHAELGLRLHVVARGWASARRLDGEHGTDGRVEGVTVVVDLDDGSLARLLADALCLLWPSHYEGFGLPLLEAMAVGTPFLSTDTGAASELAITPDQVLPLRADAWIDQLRQWRAADPTALRAASMAKARTATWARSAEALVASIERSSER